MRHYYGVDSAGKKTYITGKLKLVKSVFVPWPGGQLLSSDVPTKSPLEVWNIISSLVMISSQPPHPPLTYPLLSYDNSTPSSFLIHQSPPHTLLTPSLWL